MSYLVHSVAHQFGTWDFCAELVAFGGVEDPAEDWSPSAVPFDVIFPCSLRLPDSARPCPSSRLGEEDPPGFDTLRAFNIFLCLS